MNISDFRTLVEQRRSIRGYDEGREVSDELIKTILDCAGCARCRQRSVYTQKPGWVFPKPGLHMIRGL